MSLTFPLTWQPNAMPPKPQGGVAIGITAKQLIERIIHLPDAQQKRLKVITSQHRLIVLGKPADLPWIDNITLIAPSTQTAKLWLPIHQQLLLPDGLVEQALVQHFKRQPLLLLPSPSTVIPLDNQWTLTPKLQETLTQLCFE
ncbi:MULTISPECIES: bpX5 domain-containing protein [Enterobacterales]|uniref:bpX5 domain-containing protein n=1 Tax=Enterobacterales TaxID=91347 RepID=UPI000847E51B|nr:MULTISPECIES: hypothetical protein [Enterobacterales]WOO51528.1 hypothetical protein R2S03_10325 [Hafnia alvei]MCT6516767.1 hypothetical protein [Proteus vulgaris]ODQ04586.1 hypothetical protein BGK50_05895 [Shigella sp. FC130]OEI92119.1 hypothetical protein BHE86_07385 [Shigella sp. FC1655]OEJ07952.1 hypothetical protein BHE89_03450 [Shigella sp. FC1967]